MFILFACCRCTYVIYPYTAVAVCVCIYTHHFYTFKCLYICAYTHIYACVQTLIYVYEHTLHSHICV